MNNYLLKTTNENNLYTESALILLTLVTAPITIPLGFVGYLGYKIYNKIDKVFDLRASKTIKNKFETYGFKNVTAEDYIIRFFIKNTHFILINNSESCDFLLARKIELLWLSNNNFVFIIIDFNKIPYDYILNNIVNNISHNDQNKIMIYTTNTKMNNINNYMISIPGYYGLIYNKFICEYYNISSIIDKDLCQSQDAARNPL